MYPTNEPRDKWYRPYDNSFYSMMRSNINPSHVVNINKKLDIILDLDMTLVHCVLGLPKLPLEILKNHDIYQFDINFYEEDEEDDISSFTLPVGDTSLPEKKFIYSTSTYTVKFRPGLRDFLQSCIQIGDLYVYTMGIRQYAVKIVNLMCEICGIPEINSCRIVARDDYPEDSHKNLLRMFPSGNINKSVIIDDREDVWIGEDGMKPPHLIQIEPFAYFNESSPVFQALLNRPIKSSLSTNEKVVCRRPVLIAVPIVKGYRNDVCLKGSLEIIKRCHSIFFNEYFPIEDTSLVMSTLKQNVLRGCIVLLDKKYHDEDIIRTVEGFGAICRTDFGSDTTSFVQTPYGVLYQQENRSYPANVFQVYDGITPTHFVTDGSDYSDIFRKAIRYIPGIYVVSTVWLQTSFRTWSRPNEYDFSITFCDDSEC